MAEDVTFAQTGDSPTIEPSTFDPTSQLQSPQQTLTFGQQRCLAAVATTAALGGFAGINEGGAALTGELTPVAAVFHGIAIIETIGAGGMGVYAAFVCIGQ
jgi:hypothetical protein